MNPQASDALAGLRDIHLPEAVAFWPPAPGWWLAGLLLVVIALSLRLWLRARRRSVRRAALRELSVIEADYGARPDLPLFATQLSSLLRRVAVARYPRRDVAALHGEEWKRFLVTHGQASGFDAEIAQELATAVYAAPGRQHAPKQSWSRAVGAWIRGNT